MDVGLIIRKKLSEALMFGIFGSNGFFGKYLFGALLCMFQDNTTFWLLPATEAEISLILLTCEVCRARNLAFSPWDRLIRTTPFADLTEQRLLDVTSVSPTQAVLLVLRESIDSANPMHKALWALNSKTVTPDELRGAVAGCATRVVLEDVERMVSESG